MSLYSNKFIVIQIDLTGVISIETDIWSLPADKSGNICMLVAAVLQWERKLDLARQSRGIFSSIHFIKDIRAKWPSSNLAARYIFNLDFYHITVCTVTRVYLYLKNGSRQRRTDLTRENSPSSFKELI